MNQILVCYLYSRNSQANVLKIILTHDSNNFLLISVSFIAEPGRTLVANAYVLIVSAFAKAKRENGTWLFVDAGVYNAVLEALASQGSTEYRIRPLKKYERGSKESFILTGPTGDNLDVFNKNAMLPSDIQMGDRLAIFDTGAYSFTLMTRFNGFPKPKVISI